MNFMKFQVRFVIMGNLFCSEYAIHRRFDLKGSSLGRTTDKPESEIDATTTLKDLDLNYIFRLQKVWFQEFCRYSFTFPVYHLSLSFAFFLLLVGNLCSKSLLYDCFGLLYKLFLVRKRNKKYMNVPFPSL